MAQHDGALQQEHHHERLFFDLLVFDIPAHSVLTNEVGPGLNALKGFNLTSFSMLSPPLADGTNARGTIFIPNPSVSRYELGNLTMAMSVGGTAIGTTFLPNVFLGEGDNSISMTAIANQSAVAGLVLTQYETGVLPVDIMANSVTNMQGERIPWYEQALGALPLRVDLDVLPALQESGFAGMLAPGPPTSIS